MTTQLTSGDDSCITEGLDCILSHFPKEQTWPRTISNKATEGRQILVYNEKEALARFKQANYLDCKISAYSSYIEWTRINRQAPNLIFIDLDFDKFKSDKLVLDKALYLALNTIKSKLGSNAIPNFLL